LINILFAKALFEPNIWGYDRKPFQGIKSFFLPVALGSIEHSGFIRETRHSVFLFKDFFQSKCLFGRRPHDLFDSALLDQEGRDNVSKLVPGVTPLRVRFIPDDWPGCRKVVGHMRQLVKQTKQKVVDAVIAGRQADDRLPVAPGGLPGKGA